MVRARWNEGEELDVAVRVLLRSSPHPARLFAEMAQCWAGWPGELSWVALDPNDLELRSTHDGRGHITIRVRLGYNQPHKWVEDCECRLQFVVRTEAGQLELLAAQVATFFGQSA
jgi:hypothetical protein